jgi:Pentapeptide repeats (8 copies)
MSTSQQPDFSDQDLRHRSFRGQRLRQVSFRNADIRGCDFSRADLTGADFSGAIAGQTLRQKIVWGAVAIATLLVAGHAISRLGFSAIGQTPSDRAWSFVMALCLTLSLAGGLAGGRVWLKGIVQRLAQIVSGIVSGALTGFFYAGIGVELFQPDITTPAQAPWAIAGAIGGGLLMAVLGGRVRVPSMTILINVAGTVMAYGFALLMGATAIAFLNTQHFLGGLILLGLCGFYLWLTVNSLMIAIREIRHAAGTRFNHANLTATTFSNTTLRHSDFANAIGFTRF